MGGHHIIGGRFEIADPERDLLGRGGVGDVYLGRDLQTGDRVAIKALRPEVVAGTPDAIARFTREGEALRELNHPNIVHMVEAVEDAGRHHLVMEYVPGGSLRDLLEQQGRLPVERTVEIALDVADALTRAHRIGIIHRDLKPSNVLLAADGTARLTDFGHARLSASPRLTQTGTVLGTVFYLSPEACQGETLDARADIWAFGVMLYEMLTGEPSFAGDTFPAVFTAILTQPVPDLSLVCHNVPDALVDLIYRMLEKDRAARIPSVRMVGTELEAILGAVSTLAGICDGQQHRHCPRSGTLVPAHSAGVSDAQAQVSAISRPSASTGRFATPTPTTETARHNLPVQVTPFVGREAELSELSKLLADPNVHLLTILGPGGMGKTRLALRAAEMLAGQALHDGFAHGVYFVSLAPLQSTEAIVPTVASALGFLFYEGGKPRQQLLDYLREKQMLLLLDNYEHLLEGVDLVADILRTAPNVKVLVTSRARLSVHGEHRFHIAGMDFPDWETPGDALEHSAVKLFLQSARRAKPGFELHSDELRYVARICRLVGGMPLGILLAAAWVEMLTPEEIAAEIEQGLDFLEDSARDLPAEGALGGKRQRSVRAVFDHSWNLLAEGERAILAGLSVFRGGFTRDAARQVTDASLRELRSLVDRSLLHRAPTGRYEIHELLRQYAAEHLAASPDRECAVRDRHGAHYAAALERWAADLKGPRQLRALAEIETEIDDVRAAWEWAVEQGQVERLAQAMEGLGLFYVLHARGEEGVDAFGRAADRIAVAVLDDRAAHVARQRTLAQLWVGQSMSGQQSGHTRGFGDLPHRSLALLEELGRTGHDVRQERALALCGAGVLESWQGNRREAIPLLEESLALYRGLGDRWWTAYVLYELGRAMQGIGEFGEARRLHQEALSIQRALGDQGRIVISLLEIGQAVASQGQLAEGERLMREALEIGRKLGLRVEYAWALRRLAVATHWQGAFAESLSLSEEFLTLCRDLGHSRWLPVAWHMVGLKKAHLGYPAEARACLERGLALAREVGSQWTTAICLWSLGRLALDAEQYADGQQWLQESVAILRATGDRPELSLSLAALAGAERRLGQSSAAREHLCAALRISTEVRDASTAMSVLPFAALLLADRGEVERAVEIYALASRYPFVANSRLWEGVAGKHIAAAAATLPPDVVVAAQERGRAREQWTTAEELLAELEK